MKFTLLGLLLIALGVVVLMFGGVPYRTTETVLELGPIHATAKRDKTFEIPPPVGAGCVGVGAVLLIIGGRRKK